MYTKPVGLIDITDWDTEEREDRIVEFRRLEKRWGKRRNNHDDSVYSRVVNPIAKPVPNSVDDYVRFFYFLLGHDYAYQLSVKNPGYGNGWSHLKKYPNEELDTSKLEEMAEIAFNDPIKDHYLEMKFKNWGMSGPEGERAVIEFREHEGRIIGYQVEVPYELRDIFTITLQIPHRIYVFNHGIWVPDEFDMPTPGVNLDRVRELLSGVR